MYANRWTEQQTLTAEWYGEGAHGSWLLLDGAPPRVDAFAEGKYQVGGEWLRAVQLPLHAAEDLKAARDAAREAKQEASQREAEEELAVPSFCTVGASVLAKGLAPDGSIAKFRAVVVAVRRKTFPPCALTARAHALPRSQGPLCSPQAPGAVHRHGGQQRLPPRAPDGPPGVRAGRARGAAALTVAVRL